MSPTIRNLIDSVQKLTWFLSGSAKRKEIFLEIASHNGDDHQLVELLTANDDQHFSESNQEIVKGGKRNTVPKFWPTCWTARVSTLSALLAKYDDVLKALE